MPRLAQEEEEFCYIPMGGNLPDLSQRVLAVGGAANTVHPATGYQLCRMLASSTDLASAISSNLKSGASADVAAAAGYRALWTPNHRYQRDFQVFGGEFLGAQPVEKLRGFFDAFFQLDMDTWGGFLAGWPGLPGNEYHDAWNKRLAFGVSLFVKFPPTVALTMMVYAVTYSLEYARPPDAALLCSVATTNTTPSRPSPPTSPSHHPAPTTCLVHSRYGPALLRSFLTPLFGADGGMTALERPAINERLTATYVTGDTAAKREALEMLRVGNGAPSPQVAELEEQENGGSGKQLVEEVASRVEERAEEQEGVGV